MAGNDVIIYNFAAMEEAVKTFNSSARIIEDIAKTLDGVKPSVEAGIKSTAGKLLVGKVGNLTKNVQSAEERLRRDGINELEKYLNLGREAENAAQSLADSVSSFTME